jgi:predicted dehydrogenase
MKNRVRVGIVGCAGIAAKYAIPAFQSLPDVDLVAIASRSGDKAESWGKRYGLEAEGYDSLLAREDIDVIYSPLPVGLQERVALQAAENGKHLIGEKSITTSLDSAERMVAACRASGVAIYENFVPEFHPQHAAILSLIAGGAIGTPRAWHGAFGFPPFPAGDIRYSNQLGGGALNDCGCYTVFMARKIMQAEPVAVTCTLSMDGAEVDIRGSALLEFPGATASMAFGFDHVYQSVYSVWGSKGLVRTSPAFTMPPTKVPKVELVTNDGKQEAVEVVSVPAVDQFAMSFRYFCEAVSRGDAGEFATMGRRICLQAGVLEAMRESAASGRRVVLSA